MKKFPFCVLSCLAFAFSVSSVTGCAADAGGAAEDADGSDVRSQASALYSDAWQNIYALRQSATNQWVANPIGDYTVTCPDGVVGSECTVSSLDFGPSGLSTTRVSQLLARIAAEPSADSSSSVLVKGFFVTVIDHTTVPRTTYKEFRTSAAYWAPSVRSHGGRAAYVKAGVQSNGYQPVSVANSDMGSRVGNFTYDAAFRWVGPSTESASSYPSDSFVAFVAVRGPTFGPIQFDVDQRFLRVTN